MKALLILTALSLVGCLSHLYEMQTLTESPTHITIEAGGRVRFADIRALADKNCKQTGKKAALRDTTVRSKSSWRIYYFECD